MGTFSDVENLEDGGVNLIYEDVAPSAQVYEHGENLVYQLGGRDCLNLGFSLRDAIEDDIASRHSWENSITRGMDELGLKFEDRDFPFEGACGIYSSALLQSAVTFISSVALELLPPEGPAFFRISEEASDQLEDRGNRVIEWLNTYLTQIDSEYYPDWEQSLLWFCLTGNLFKKVTLNPYTGYPISRYIRPQDFIVNSVVSSLEEATRCTQVLTLTEKELRLKQAKGIYADFDLMPSVDSYNQSTIEKKVKEIEGIDHQDWKYNKKVKLYECHVDLNLNLEHQFGSDYHNIPFPYIVTLSADTAKILGIYRNWHPGAKVPRKINHFIHTRYFSGLDFYGLGLFHLVGGNAKAATILQRQLIDAGTLANFPGGLRVKGMKLESNNIRIGPTEFIELDTGGLPIDQAVMLMPYKDPSPISSDMQKSLEDNISSIAGSLNKTIADFNPNAPVGTTMTLLAESHKVQSSVMQRLHRGLGKELKTIYEMFYQVLPDQPYSANTADQPLMKADFAPGLQLIPVADPNISSGSHRLLRAQSILQFAQSAPDIHNLPEAFTLVYKELKMSKEEIDKLLPKPESPPPPPPPPLDPSIPLMKEIETKALADKQRFQIEIEKLKQQQMKIEGDLRNKGEELRLKAIQLQQQEAKATQMS